MTFKKCGLNKNIAREHNGSRAILRDKNGSIASMAFSDLENWRRWYGMEKKK